MSIPCENKPNCPVQGDGVYYAMCFDGAKCFWFPTTGNLIPEGNVDGTTPDMSFNLQHEDSISCYANGSKMWARIKILGKDSIHRATIVRITDVLFVHRFMEFIATFNSKNFAQTLIDNAPKPEIKSTPVQESDKKESVEKATEAQPKELESDVVLDVRLKRDKCYGVDCWNIPSYLNCTLTLYCDRKMIGYHMAYKSRKGGNVTSTYIGRSGKEKDNTTVNVSATEVDKFWFIDVNENLIDVRIRNVEVYTSFN
jgi:hypothetical protein